MKGIILAGGTGSRLFPITISTSKQLLPVYDKPLIYYPLSTLMLSGIKDILIISTPKDIDRYKELLGDGSNLGINIQYQIQEKPKGLAEAFILGEKFIEKDNVCLILGDNIFFGQGLSQIMEKVVSDFKTPTIFGYPVENPREFGVVEFDSQGNVVSIEEKPEKPKTNYIVPGLYFYDSEVVSIAKTIKPSKRGELEITSINNEYLRRKKLKINILGRGLAWFDTGSPTGLLKASIFVETIQSSQGFYIACLEEIAYNKGYIDKKQLTEIAKKYSNTEYGKYLSRLG